MPGIVLGPEAALRHELRVVPPAVLDRELLFVLVFPVEEPHDLASAANADRALLLCWGHVCECCMRHPGENLSRADWLVERTPHGEAVAAIYAWHYSKSAPNTGQTFGLFARASYPLSALSGAALWLPPTRRAAEAVAGSEWRNVLSLSRLAVSPELPRNAATFLLARSMRLLDRERWPILLTYADTRHGHTGAIYRATGWTLDAVTSTGAYFVTRDGRQVGRKRGNRNIPVAELRAQGCVEHRSDKLRFVHRKAAA